MRHGDAEPSSPVRMSAGLLPRRSSTQDRPVADRLYLCALDDWSELPLVPDPIFGLALATALLGELLLTNSLTLAGYQLQAGPRQPSGETGAGVWDDLAQERGTDRVEDWLRRVADTAASRVGERLVVAGLGSRRVVRRRGRLHDRVVPADDFAHFAPRAVLSGKITDRVPLTDSDHVVLGILELLGITRRVIFIGARRRHGWVRRSLTAMPTQLQELMGNFDMVLATGVITGPA